MVLYNLHMLMTLCFVVSLPWKFFSLLMCLLTFSSAYAVRYS